MLAQVRLVEVQVRFVELVGALEVVVDDLCSLVEECDARPVSRNLLLHLCQLDLFVGVDAPRTIREAHQVLQVMIDGSGTQRSCLDGFGTAKGVEILRRLDSRRELGLMRPCFRKLLTDLRGLIGEGYCFLQLLSLLQVLLPF